MGLGAALWHELTAGLMGSSDEIARIVVRLLVAIVLGGILGFQRIHAGQVAGIRTHIAGMRTHMLVTLGAAIVVLLPQLTGMSSDGLSRIIQGTLAGIGFIGGGVILKMSEQHQIVGITTAATIWLTATIGIATGTGRLGLAVVGMPSCGRAPSSSTRIRSLMIFMALFLSLFCQATNLGDALGRRSSTSLPLTSSSWLGDRPRRPRCRTRRQGSTGPSILPGLALRC